MLATSKKICKLKLLIENDYYYSYDFKNTTS